MKVLSRKIEKGWLIQCFALGVLSIGAIQAQTPSIAGIYDANTTQSNPLYVDRYVSIYGSNLSSGSGSIVNVAVPHTECGPTFCYGLPNNYQFNSSNGGGFWYESSGQINFYLPSSIFRVDNATYGGIHVHAYGQNSNLVSPNVIY